jgi:hypothetical protein
MTTKAARAIVCEGKDDLAALRAMLVIEGATQKRMGLPPGQLRFESDRVALTLESVDGKSDLAERTLLAAEGGARSAALHPRRSSAAHPPRARRNSPSISSTHQIPTAAASNRKNPDSTPWSRSAGPNT